MSTQLFACEGFNMAGIKYFKFAAKDGSNNPLDFPLNFTLKQNDESIIVLSDDEENRLITIGGTQIKYRIVYPNYSKIDEDMVEDRQGRYYKKTLEFTLPQVSLTTNNQLKDFLFTDSGEFAVSNAVAFITDMNDNTWIVGYDNPLILQSFDLQTDVRDGSNRYVFNYTSNGYGKIKQYEVV